MSDTKYYAGIGSRRTPSSMLGAMKLLARRLAREGWTLRSGAADGADAAFEAGCDSVAGPKDIWLPWAAFNGHTGAASYPQPWHEAQVGDAHPAAARLSAAPFALHARNVGQVLGADGSNPLQLVICWTPDLCEHHTERSRETGGTGSAITLASKRGIPVFNLARPDAFERLDAWLAARAELARELAAPINIASRESGLGGALTNMTELARSKGHIKYPYPVRLNGTTYPDSEAAYQALKVPGAVGYNDALMIDIIARKLQQHPRLFELVQHAGGEAWLTLCSHFTGARSARFQAWEGQGLESRFIRALVEGYRKARTGRSRSTHVTHVERAPFDIYIGHLVAHEHDMGWGVPEKFDAGAPPSQVVEHYAKWLQTQPALLARLPALQGMTLGCSCKEARSADGCCHGKVLAALLRGERFEPARQQEELF